MTTPHEAVARAIADARYKFNAYSPTACGPEELAVHAIGALRKGAVERVQFMHANKYGAACSVLDAEGFIDAILGPPNEVPE